MRLPAPLSRRKKNVHKNTFGHVLVLAGSRAMLGAAALTGLAAMRAGAGLVTIGVPSSLNAILQKKISPVIMTLPLDETREQTISLAALRKIRPLFSRFQAVVIGPGLSQHSSTKKFIQNVVEHCPLPMVIDADALNAFPVHRPSSIVHRLILTPHPGEFARMIGKKKEWIEKHRREVARDFSRKNKVILVLKGPRTVIADPSGKVYINSTGNSGMATAGSGDVLTGMITALLAQGLAAFDAAKWGVYLHGLAGDLAAKSKTRASMIATDIIACIPNALKQCKIN